MGIQGQEDRDLARTRSVEMKGQSRGIRKAKHGGTLL